MCKYKVKEKVRLNLLDIIHIFDLFLKSAKEVLTMNTNKSKVTIHKFVFSIC